MELFEFLLPKHVLLLNVDWSSNHAAMHPDTHTLTNMRVLFGAQPSVNGKDEPQVMTVFSDNYTLEEGDLGTNIDKKWKDKIKVVKRRDSSLRRARLHSMRRKALKRARGRRKRLESIIWPSASGGW